jgi:hypothetical protein
MTPTPVQILFEMIHEEGHFCFTFDGIQLQTRVSWISIENGPIYTVDHHTLEVTCSKSPVLIGNLHDPDFQEKLSARLKMDVINDR